jgi:acyl dehydratase
MEGARVADALWAYEDFEVGAEIDLGEKLITAEEIVEFATEFDPQPMHLDRAAGESSLLGGLGASGWHTCAIFMRMMCDAFLLNSTSEGAPGIDHVRWRRPVLAGDRLTGRCTVLSKRPSQKRPTIGLVQCRHELFNQDGEAVFELQNTVMFARREAAA